MPTIQHVDISLCIYSFLINQQTINCAKEAQPSQTNLPFWGRGWWFRGSWSVRKTDILHTFSLWKKKKKSTGTNLNFPLPWYQRIKVKFDPCADNVQGFYNPQLPPLTRRWCNRLNMKSQGFKRLYVIMCFITEICSRLTSLKSNNVFCKASVIQLSPKLKVR